jgi:hypothetical protein
MGKIILSVDPISTSGRRSRRIGKAEVMATTERTVARSESPSAALSMCARTLTAARFKNVNQSLANMTVTATKRDFGQSKRANISVIVRTLGTGSEITVQCNTLATSLISLARNPSAQVVDDFIRALPPESKGDASQSVAKSPGRGTRVCPWCAESIKPAAIVCRFCGRDVQPIDLESSAVELQPSGLEYDVTYETDTWSEDQRTSFARLLTRKGVPHEWTGTDIRVDRHYEQLVDSLLSG